MSIPDNRRGKLAASSASPNLSDYAADIHQARNLAAMGVPIFSCRLNRDGNPSGAYDWQKTEPGEESVRAIDRWKPGMGLGAVCGSVFDVVDVDPRNGGAESWPLALDRMADDPPEIFGIAATPSRGGHFWIASQGVRKKTDILKGIDLQAQGGFVFIAPTVRPSKAKDDAGVLRPYTWVSPVHWNVSPWMQDQSQAFAELPWAVGGAEPAANGSRRRPAQELMDEVLSAEAGDQRGALLRLVREYEMCGLSREAITDTLRNFLPRVPSFDPDNKWYPARGNPDKWIISLFSRQGKIRPDATAEEMAGMREAQPNIADDEEETEFWGCRPVHAHIRSWARARRASPWGVLGECLAEAVCHTPSGFQLPPIIGGNGSLNMLVAMVAKSGLGKNAAANAAEVAFQWEGVLGVCRSREGCREFLSAPAKVSPRHSDTWGMTRTRKRC